MKIVYGLFISTVLVCVLSCSGNNKDKVKEDPAKVVVPDNTSATNPSLADTAYPARDSTRKKDSLKK